MLFVCAQVLRDCTTDKCVGIVRYRIVAQRTNTRCTNEVELLNFMAQCGDGVLLHYLWCQHVKDMGMEVSHPRPFCA